MLLYKHYFENRYAVSSWRNLIRLILVRCFCKLYVMEKSGTGSPVVFLSRNTTSMRKDHLNNTRKVCSLIENKTIIYGKRFAGFTLLNLNTLHYPLVWNAQLKRFVKEKKLRWQVIENTYFDYLDFLEYLRFEKKHLLNPDGLILLSETHSVSQFMGQYFKNRKKTTVALMHSLMSKGSLEKMEVYNSMCDYLLSYSPFATDKAEAKAYDRYKKGIYELGMIQFIKSGIRNRNIRKVHKMGIYLDSNLRMIQTALDAVKDMDIEVYVKCHPSSTAEQIKYWQRNIRSNSGITFYSTEVLSLKLEKTTDIMILRNTNCLMEGVYQQIPVFIYNLEPVDFKGLPENIYFSSAEELKEQIRCVQNGELKEPMQKLKEYMCGAQNPDVSYKEFFNSLGWK